MAVKKNTRRGKSYLVIDISYVDTATGKPARYRHDAEVQTKAAAMAEDRRRIIELTTGAPVHVGRPTVAAAPAVKVSTAPTFKSVVKDYLATYAMTAIKTSTKSGYEKLLTGFLLPRLGDTPIDQIDSAKVREVDAVMVARGRKAGTRRQAMIVIRSVLCRYAVEAGLLKVAPRLPAMPRQGAKLPATMSAAEVEAVLAVASKGHRLAFLLACDAGLRAGEVRALRRCDVDLEEGHLTVRESRCRGTTGTPKSGHERVVPLTDRLREAVVGRGKGKPMDLICVTEHGLPWGETGLLQAWRRACAKAGVQRWRLHDARHWFTSELFRRGVGAPTVQALLGHGSIAVTARYAHSTRAAAVDAIGRLSAGNGLATAAE